MSSKSVTVQKREQTGQHPSEPPLTTLAARAAAIEQAFDYRGDVTITLASGELVEGYLFNREMRAQSPFVEMYPKKGGPSVRYAVAEIVHVQFTGTDTAAGKSWDAWLEKVAAAEKNGTFAELYPESLED